MSSNGWNWEDFRQSSLAKSKQAGEHGAVATVNNNRNCEPGRHKMNVASQNLQLWLIEIYLWKFSKGLSTKILSFKKFGTMWYVCSAACQDDRIGNEPRGAQSESIPSTSKKPWGQHENHYFQDTCNPNQTVRLGCPEFSLLDSTSSNWVTHVHVYTICCTSPNRKCAAEKLLLKLD